MRNLLAQVGHFFEAHVEKMVLALAALISLYLLITQVILGPDRVQYDKQLCSPSQVDHLNARKARTVADAFSAAPAVKESYRSPLTAPLDPNDPIRKGIRGPLAHGFEGLYQSPLSTLTGVQVAVLPSTAPSGTNKAPVAKDRTYRLPQVVEIEGVKVDHIRAAAYVPVKPVTEGNAYQDSGCEINDLDLVTVEGKFDMAALKERFHESFAGDEVPATWRDATLAEPVVVAVELQRQHRLADGQWSQWEVVPRGRVEARRDLYQMAQADQTASASGVGIRRIQFTNPEVLCDLLQPPAYQIASAYDQWLPPSLHGEYAELVAKQAKEEQRQKREEEKAAQDAGRGRRQDNAMGGPDGMPGAGGQGRGRATAGGRGAIDPATGRAATRGGRANSGAGPYGAYGAYGAQPAPGTGRRGGARGGPAGGPGEYGMDPAMMAGAPGMENQMAINQVLMKFQELRLTPLTDFAKLKQVTFWANDDAPVAGGQYRYRLRLGVLNPVAGTDQVTAADAARKNQVILWSPFSDVTPVVEVQGREYFFAKDYQENSGVVNVEVCKFLLGYWRTQDFSVRPGEAVGREMETKSKDATAKARMMMDPAMSPYGMPYGAQPAEDATFQPATIDYSTGIMLVGVSRVDGWTGSSRLRAQAYYDMLYSTDGASIGRVPVGSSNWSAEQSSTYAAIRKQKAMAIEPPRSFNDSIGGAMGMGPGGPGYGYGMPGGRAPLTPSRRD
jgi:hypothetical protein